MAKIDQLTNGLQGLLARQRLNEAIKSVEVDSSLTGDGNSGTPLSAATALATKGEKINNRVVINSLSDFPTPVGGVITLVADTEYYLGGNINVGTNKFTLASNVTFRGAGPRISSIISTATGDLFTGTDVVSFNIIQAGIDCVNASLLNVTDTVQGTTIVFVSDVNVFQAVSLGTVGNLLSLNFSNSAAFNLSSDGLTFTGNTSIVSIRQFFMTSASITFKGLDLGTNISPTIEIQDLIVQAPSGAYGISGLADSGNVAAGSIASVTSSEFLGGVTPLENITEDDVQWSFMDNSGIPDTLQAALVYFEGNATQTTINTTNVYEKVNATWSEQIAKHFITDSTGRITYKGIKPMTIYIDAVCDVLTSASNNITQMAMYLNGSLEKSGIEALAGTSAAANLYVVWQVTLNTDDYVELFIRNKDSSQNLIAVNATASIR